MHDQEISARLKAGDETAFREIVSSYGGRLARLARSFSRNEAVIEEAVQETWLAVIRGIHGFEGRAPLRTWILGILVNQARRLAVREHRHARLGSAGAAPSQEDAGDREPGMGDNGMWVKPPVPWALLDPEATLLAKETLNVIARAVEDLPEAQRQVVLLRDVEGLGAEDACNMLAISDTHQRVLLHRGRARVRRALNAYLSEGTLRPEARREKVSR